MNPIYFPTQNVVYTGSTPAVGDLPCERIKPGMIKSVWQPNPQERRILAEGGQVCLYIYNEPIPPVALTAEAIVSSDPQSIPEKEPDDDASD